MVMNVNIYTMYMYVQVEWIICGEWKSGLHYQAMEPQVSLKMAVGETTFTHAHVYMYTHMYMYMCVR